MVAFLAAAALATPTLRGENLLQNGSFEQPGTDELSELFKTDQQQIPGWRFTGGSVEVVNHVRLLPGDGFQCLLLPCLDGVPGIIRQTFTLPASAPLRLSFKLAASKAVDGTVEVLLDDHVARTVRLADSWKPEEIALTDQMKWISFALPPVEAAAGNHSVGFRVARFEPRNDHQGDTRDIVQGVLVDAVSVETGPEREVDAEKPTREWPPEMESGYIPTGLLPLDALAGPWMTTRTLACYPSLANFFGALRSTKELGGIQYLHFNDLRVNGVIGALSVDGQPLYCEQSRWYPYQLLTRTRFGALDLEAATRLVFSDTGALTKITITNTSAEPVTRTMAMVVPPGSTASGSSDLTDPQFPHPAYRFTLPFDGLVSQGGVLQAQWKLVVPAHSTQEISVALAVDASPEAARKKAREWGSSFAASFDLARSGWEKRWQDVFTPGNATYSGSLPVLETNDRKLRELYYLSVASLLQVERDNTPLFKQTWVGEDPEWGGNVTWFWDVSLTSLPYALLNPAVMKEELRHWLTIDWRACSHFNVLDGKSEGAWYAVNPYAYFLTLDRYLTVTGDSGFLSEMIHDKTVLDSLEALATDWQRLVPAGATLADIGGNSWNMLEAPPNYVHTVASLNAANVWMMRRLADYQEAAGNGRRAGELRQQAGALVPGVLRLYQPGTGSWNVEYPGGKIIDSRHVYDYLTVGTTISGDLSPEIRTGMMNFLDRELMTETWLRAMSRQDPSAFDSDRSDHGPAGSYAGWPAKAGQATAEMGRFDKALDMFHRFRGAFDSAIPQALELTRVQGRDGLHARVSTRAGASFAEVSGSFAEVVINTFFGFRPTPDGKTGLWESEIPRGLDGCLLHVRWKNSLYTVASDGSGLHLEKE